MVKRQLIGSGHFQRISAKVIVGDVGKNKGISGAQGLGSQIQVIEKLIFLVPVPAGKKTLVVGCYGGIGKKTKLLRSQAAPVIVQVKAGNAPAEVVIQNAHFRWGNPAGIIRWFFRTPFTETGKQGQQAKRKKPGSNVVRKQRGHPDKDRPLSFSESARFRGKGFAKQGLNDTFAP